MSISGVSSNPIATAYVPAAYQQPAPATATAPAKAPSKDSVTISVKAQQLASDGDTAATEFTESAAEKASETLKGKK